MPSTKPSDALYEQLCNEGGREDGISVEDTILRKEIHLCNHSSSSSRSRSRINNRSFNSDCIKTSSFCEDNKSCCMESYYTDYSDDFCSDALTELCHTEHSEKQVKPSVKKQYRISNTKPINQTKSHNKTKTKCLPALKDSCLKIHSLDSSQLNMFSSDQQFVPSRILSARIKRINELQNEISDQTRQLEATFSENKALKKLQQRHMKALINFEAKEGSLSQLFVRHNTEVKTLRELLRNSKMQGQSMSRKLQETNVELLKTKNVLHKLQKLSEDKNLAERNEIIQQLSVVADKLDNKEKKIQELENCMQLNNKCFTHQLTAETRKTAEAQEFTKILKMEVYLLMQKIREKEKELEIRNIYANRIREIKKKDAVSLQRKGELVNKDVQTDVSILPSSLLYPLYQDIGTAAVFLTQSLDNRTSLNFSSKTQKQLHQSDLKNDYQRIDSLNYNMMMNNPEYQEVSESVTEIQLNDEKLYNFSNLSNGLQKEKGYNKLEGEKHLDTFEGDINKIHQDEQATITKNDSEEEKKKQMWICEETVQKNKGFEKCEHKEGGQQLQRENKISKKMSNCSKFSNASSYEPIMFSEPRRYKFTEPVENLYQGRPAYGLPQAIHNRSVSIHFRRKSELEAATYKNNLVNQSTERKQNVVGNVAENKKGKKTPCNHIQ